MLLCCILFWYYCPMNSQIKPSNIRRKVLIAIGSLLVLISFIWFGFKYLAKITPAQDTDQTYIFEDPEHTYEADSDNKVPAEQMSDTTIEETLPTDN